MKFTVNGIPRPLKRHRHTRNGRTYDPSVKDKQSFATQAALKRPGEPLNGALRLKLTFYMPRPKSHYRTGKRSHVLKAKAPVFHSIKPDLDNLVKLISDCIGRRTFIVDDSQICALASIKVYSDDLDWNNDHPRTEVEIKEI